MTTSPRCRRAPVAFLVVAVLSSAACAGSGASAPADRTPPAPVTTADGRWSLTSSLAFDALYYLNVLAGSPVTLVNPALAAEHDRARAQMTADELTALSRLGLLARWTGENLGSTLALMVAQDRPADLARLSAVFADGAGCLSRADGVSQAYAGVPLDGDQRAVVGQVCASVVTLVGFMQRDGWEARWWSDVLPAEEAHIAALAQGLAGGPDLLSIENRYAGKDYAPGPVNVYVEAYASGYGSSLRGLGFITSTDASQDAAATISMALHELAHDPFPHDDRFAALAAAYAADPFFAAAVNPNYPSPAYWFSEELTDAFEVYMDFAAIDGAHAARYLADLEARGDRLAPVVFSRASAEGLYGTSETFAAFVMRMVDEGKLVPGQLATEYAQL